MYEENVKKCIGVSYGSSYAHAGYCFAAEDEPTLISTQEVALSPSGANTRSAETKEFTLSTYEDNGRTVYSFDVEDEEYRQAAMEYINELTGDPGPTPQTRGICSLESLSIITIHSMMAMRCLTHGKEILPVKQIIILRADSHRFGLEAEIVTTSY